MATETVLTISDAARATGVSAHTLRYYERAGLLDPVDRAASGHRCYAELMRGGAHLAETERNLELIDSKIDYYRERLGL
jgi:predicted site-specific integrase-resolvase